MILITLGSFFLSDFLGYPFFIKDYPANKSHIKKVFEIPGKWILSNRQAVIVHTEPYHSKIKKNFETILCLYDQFEFQKS